MKKKKMYFDVLFYNSIYPINYMTLEEDGKISFKQGGYEARIGRVTYVTICITKSNVEDVI